MTQLNRVRSNVAYPSDAAHTKISDFISVRSHHVKKCPTVRSLDDDDRRLRFEHLAVTRVGPFEGNVEFVVRERFTSDV